MKILYPNEARLKNITYGCDVFIDIDVEYSLFNENTGKYIYQNVPAPSNNFMKNKFLTRLPVMINSKICALNGLPDTVKRNLGEGKYDHGGYFIIDGREKTIVSTERKAENKIFLHKADVDKLTHYAEVKSTSLIDFAQQEQTEYNMKKWFNYS